MSKSKKKSSSRGPSPSPVEPPFQETTQSRQRSAHSSDEEVVAWLHVNGITTEQFIQRGHLVSRMEGKYSKRRRSNVAVIINRMVFY